ncbi:hypothetical protein FRC12_020089 [Ceratobasidium sp. 428]|nr:hypothetical protein FRC12_020089 [Ceratobasidium sp. 428]
MAFNSPGRQSTLNEWNNRPDAEKIFALRAKLEEYKSNAAIIEQAQPPRTIELSSNEQSHAARTKDADGGSRLKITATTPLSVVMDIFNSFAKINDYTAELQAESNNTIDPIAYGGYSDVYRATLRRGTHVAVKCMRSSVTGDYDAVKVRYTGLCLPAMLLNQLTSARLVSLIPGLNYDIKIFSSSLEWLSSEANLPWSHSGWIEVHGDLKGANILIAIDGTPKITDFGLAVIHDGVFNYSATNGGGGTTRWMVNTGAFYDAGQQLTQPQAPELFTERAIRTYQTDVYALGMTLLEIFTGKEPFYNIANVQAIPILVACERKTPERPEFLAPGARQGDLFWTVLTKCWVFEPDKRLKVLDIKALVQPGSVDY